MAMSCSFAFRLSQFFLTLSIILPLITNTKLPQRLVVKLIYHDSIFSPFYNHNDNISDRAKRILRSSNARFAYLQMKVKRTLESNGAQAGLLADTNHGFLVKFSIGNPPIPQLAIMDTGSSFIWVRCKPCNNCDRQRNCPVFDPLNSSSYRNVSCEDHSCTLSEAFDHFPCGLHNDICRYQVSYGDGTISIGHIATEQMTFDTPDDGMIEVLDVLFGCGLNNSEKEGELTDSGVFGLGILTPIVNKLGNRFSYCIGNIHDPGYEFNRLVFGDASIVEGFATPFNKRLGEYFLTVEGISVGEERLDIDPKAFSVVPGAGVLIDSGTELSFLPRVVYDKISEKVSSLSDGILTRAVNPQARAQLCYHGIISRDLEGFPVLTFHLAVGADLVLDTVSLFYPIDTTVFCMSILPMGPINLDQTPIIGIMAQQSYNVAYDLNEEKIYFQRIDCELFDG